jgi:hypothetical protein
MMPVRAYPGKEPIVRYPGACWGRVAGVVLWLAVSAAAAQGQTRIETQAAADGSGKSEVRVWVNGKEVAPGEKLEFKPGPGAVRVPARAEMGEATEAYLGVMVGPLEGKAKEEVETHKGVAVTGVTPDSPAAKAGLLAGDVIVDIGGTAMESPQQLIAHVRQFKAGQDVKVTLYRAGKKVEKTVTLAVRQPAEGKAAPAKEPPAAGEGFLGVVAAPLAAEMKEIAGTDRGVLINSLPDDSPAAKAGLMAGDVIVSVDGKEVGSPPDLVDLVRRHKAGDVLKIAYFRMGKRREAEVKLGARPAERMPPGLESPENLLEQMPELRQYLEELGKGMPRAVPAPPDTAPQMRPRLEMPEPYGVGKDIGKILERLDQIERRLDQLEKKK